MNSLRINVTRADIDKAAETFNARPDDRVHTCPIAQSLIRRGFTDVYVAGTIIASGVRYEHSQASLDFMHEADNWNDEINPRSFTVKEYTY